MPTPDELDELKVVFENLVGRTPSDEEIEALKACFKGNQSINFQVAKYINNVTEAQNSQFGDTHKLKPPAYRFSQNADTEAIQPAKLNQNQLSVDDVVQKVRLRFHDDIQRLHGTMPLLGVDHWVDLGDLFVDVNILKEVSSSRKSELDELWQDFSAGVQKYSSYRSLDRIGLGKHQQRVSGLTVLGKNTNLMVVGKPGSGKTTYLQHIVTECNEGRLQPHRIPVLIKLREFVDDGRKFEYSLERYLTQQWRLSEAETELVLSQGKALILLDGLDEVTGADGRVISKQIKQFTRTYPQNQLIVTCRTQSQESRFERFDYVEVADFDETQVNAFAKHWFKAVCSDAEEGQAKAREFLDKLYIEENKPIRELAITPILLSLTCAVFQVQGKFYSKRSKLYEEGLELLLEKWDKSREIERDEIYRDLSVERKQELLSYLAVKKFEQPQYVLFEQEEIEGYIAEFLEISRRDSRVVLRAIEAQHGLLIERAQKVWSFSHLTFQEYCVAKWFCIQADWNKLIEQVINKHWREALLLLAETLTSTDDFLNLLKEYADSLLARDEKSQLFLRWLVKKARSVDVVYEPAAVRAFYFSLMSDDIHTQQLARNLDNRLHSDFSRLHEFTSELAFDYVLWRAFYKTDSIFLPNTLDWDLERADSIAQQLNMDIDIRYSLQKIRDILPNPDNIEKFSEVWTKNGQAWTQELRQFMLKKRNLGYSWQFNELQIKLLHDYNYVNKLLVDCLKSSCAVSEEVTQEIQETLLLPIAEIEKRFP